MQLPNSTLTTIACALLCAYALAACSTTGAAATDVHPKAATVGNSPATATAAAGSHTSNLCPSGDDGGRRLNDLAEHVYDGAVADYLLDNASEIGREVTPESEAYALMLLVDDAVYQTCVTLPERCLRTEFRRGTERKEMKVLLSGKAAYAYQRARACLQRAGDAYAAREPGWASDPVPLDATYRERVLPHLVGHMMPVALLRDSSFFGTDHNGLHEAALRSWHECYANLAETPVNPARLAQRVTHDLIATLECAWDFHEKTWGAGSPNLLSAQTSAQFGLSQQHGRPRPGRS